MDRWNCRGESSQRRERVRREEVRRKKIKMREKVEKSRNTVFFQCFVAPGGSKSRRANGGCGAICRDVGGARHMSKWKCKKKPHVRSTFGSWAVEKGHAVVARSTFGSQNAKNTWSPSRFCHYSAQTSHAARQPGGSQAGRQTNRQIDR